MGFHDTYSADNIKYSAVWDASLKAWVTKYGAVVGVDKVAYDFLSEKDKEEYNRQVSKQMERESKSKKKETVIDDEIAESVDATWDSIEWVWRAVKDGREIPLWQVNPDTLSAKDYDEYNIQIGKDYDYSF